MKLIPKLRFLIPSKLSPSTIVAGVLTFFIVTSIVAFVSGIYLGKDARIEEAMANAQRLEYIFDKDEMIGNVLVTESKDSIKVADGNEDKSEDDSKIIETKKEPDDELAWLNEDFIGPRMPQSFLDIILESYAASQKVETVKLSDISDKPIIVIILKGLGLSASTTKMAMDLPKSITFGFSPYSSTVQDWVDKAKEQGREVVLHIPMETKDYRLNDPGPYALLTQSSKEDNLTRLNMLLGLIKGYEAVYSERDEIFTHTLSSSKPVLQTLKTKLKYLVFGGGYADFSLLQLADEMEYPILVNDFILDDDISQRSINEKLKKIEQTAKEKGYVVVMAHPYPITIRMLEMWLPEVQERGVMIAPVSLLLGKKIIKE